MKYYRIQIFILLYSRSSWSKDEIEKKVVGTLKIETLFLMHNWTHLKFCRFETNKKATAMIAVTGNGGN